MSEKKITKTILLHVQSLQRENGTITPEMVVADAKNPESPLHALFDWDVDSAARKHWLDQARALIAKVEIIITTETFSVKAPMFVRDTSVGSKEQGYVSVLMLQKNPAQARQTLLVEFNRVQASLERARTVAGALGLEREVEQLLATAIGMRRQIDEAA